MSLAFKLVVSICLSLALTLALIGLLAHLKLQSERLKVVESELQVLLANIERPIEHSMDLGLGLTEIENASAIIARVVAENADVNGAFVVDADGRIAFASDPGRAGQPAPADWRAAQRATGQAEYWRLRAERRLVVGRRIDSSFESGVGTAVLVYSLADLAADRQAVLRGLLGTGTALLLAFAPLVVGAVLLISHRLRGALHALAAQLMAPWDEPGADRCQPGTLAEVARRLRASFAAADMELRRIEQELPLDEAGGGPTPRSD